VRVFKNTWFTLFACNEDILDSDLKEAVNRLEAGQAVNLGGNVYKIRLARPGKGKSSGYRVIVLFRKGDRTFYVYGFAKSKLDNISEKELRYFKDKAKDYFSLTDDQLERMIREDQLVEI